MDDGVNVAVAEAGAVNVEANDLSMPERLMLAEQAGNRTEVEKILKQVYYCWAPFDNS